MKDIITVMYNTDFEGLIGTLLVDKDVWETFKQLHDLDPKSSFVPDHLLDELTYTSLKILRNKIKDKLKQEDESGNSR